ncbi:MAG: hypothetical protein IKY03_01055 [Clostridia bacterium]|nr:hypothetical protein [Clostridia bacterium]
MKYLRKRTTVGILILLLLLVPVSRALGEDEIGIKVSNTAIASDGQAAVTVSLSNCRGMDSVQFDIWYDAHAVMLADAAPGDLLAGGIYAFNTETPGIIRFAYASAEGLEEGNGTAVNLTFAALQDTGTAVLVSEARASRFDGENGTGQTKAFVTVENGGITPADSEIVPEAGITPWIPETPTPSPEPTPEPTETPRMQVQATPEIPEESPKQTDPIMRLAYLAGGGAVIAFAAAAVLLLSGRKKRD